MYLFLTWLPGPGICVGKVYTMYIYTWYILVFNTHGVPILIPKNTTKSIETRTAKSLFFLARSDFLLFHGSKAKSLTPTAFQRNLNHHLYKRNGETKVPHA